MNLPLRVNADYEAELFTGKKSPPVINEALEFLALYLEDRPVFTAKTYTDEYLSHVERFTGRRPQTLSKGPCENWWGSLTHIELERKLNSKEFSATLSGSNVVTSIDELKLLPGITYLAKDPGGMSGQNFITCKKGEEELLQKAFAAKRKLIVEPLLNRISDFSHYVFPDNSLICYENLVDKKFQYKGTVFHDLKMPDTQHLSFFGRLKSQDWSEFEEQRKKIIETYRAAGATEGFSIDSFIYQNEDGNLKIHAISEVNYRKTMGLIAHMLLHKLAPKSNWGAFILAKNPSSRNFVTRLKKLSEEPRIIYLSPGDTRFEMFLISADSYDEGKKIFETLKRLLPDTEFAIEI